MVNLTYITAYELIAENRRFCCLMKAPVDAVLTALGGTFYQTVPIELRTYCALTAQITAHALADMGLHTHLLECQVLYGYPQGNFLVGFTDQEQPGKWNGHVVCTCEGWLIDAATQHLRVVESLMPDLVIARLLPPWSSALAKKSLDEHRSILWLRPPPGNWQPTPSEPMDLVRHHGSALANAVRRRLGDERRER